MQMSLPQWMATVEFFACARRRRDEILHYLNGIERHCSFIFTLDIAKARRKFDPSRETEEEETFVIDYSYASPFLPIALVAGQNNYYPYAHLILSITILVYRGKRRGSPHETYIKVAVHRPQKALYPIPKVVNFGERNSARLIFLHFSTLLGFLRSLEEMGYLPVICYEDGYEPIFSRCVHPDPSLFW